MMRTQRPLFVLGALLLVAPVGRNAAAQSSSGSASLEGSIKDTAGRAVANASVRITATETGYARTVPTRADGRFVAPMLPVGHYSLEANAEGFSAGRLDGVVLRVGATETVEIDLKPSDAEGQISISTE